MSLATNLVYNNRFATKKINAEQVGAETASAWTLAIKVLHRSAYAVYEYCENNGLRIDDNSINKNEVFEDLKRILAKIGDVNGRKLYANETAVNLIVGYAGKRANKDSDELKNILADIREKKKAIEEYLAVYPFRYTETEAYLFEKFLSFIILFQKFKTAFPVVCRKKRFY